MTSDILDDTNGIHNIDRSQMRESLVRFPRHITDALKKMQKVYVPPDYSTCKNIVVTGMGGSGIPGDFLKVLFYKECSVPIIVNKDYDIPSFVDSSTLVFAVSYSGTTEETISAFQESIMKGAKVFGITSGQQLLALCREKQVPHFVAPVGRTTRECFAYLLFPMIDVMRHVGFITPQESEIQETIEGLLDLSKTYSLENKTPSNPAKEIALQLLDRIPIIYGSINLTDAVALRLKHQLNENCKVFAQAETFPDVTHNQIAAFKQPEGFEKQISAIFLRDIDETPELRRRIDAAKSVLHAKEVTVTEIYGQGVSLMSRLISQMYLGDWASFYLAMLRGYDPTPTQAMSEIKKKLGLVDLSPNAD